MKNTEEFLRDEEGSLSVLIIGLFLLLLSLSIGIIDLADSYLAKRELNQIGESAVAIAAQSLDQARYYQDGILNSNGKVPIDCALANIEFRSEIGKNFLRGRDITVDAVTCDGDLLDVSISSRIRPLVTFPLFNQITGPEIAISAQVEAGSIAK